VRRATGNDHNRSKSQAGAQPAVCQASTSRTSHSS
jgi:hypothetical protein